MTLSPGVSCPRGPRWRCPFGFCLRCGLHAPTVHHLLQIMSPVEQPVHVPRAVGHLCHFLCSRGPQYPLHVCQCLHRLDSSPTPPNEHEKKQMLTTWFPHASEEQLGDKDKSLRKYLNIVWLDQNNLWGGMCARRMETSKHFSLFTFLPTRKVS